MEEIRGARVISREQGVRRVTLQCNVRGRDLAGFVKEAQQKLDAEITLPPGGYRIVWGGQFENLLAAKARLSVAVPVALGLILVLLYFAFGSIKESLLIFTAIPMSAIGGVFALWLRDMPFSISAGVGFIALFGVAVLNGIVLIAYFNELGKEGRDSLHDRILFGASVRLRPVLMTASVASLGFLPMAISSGAGAEVQRPLATVVIGGLVTSTLLTLLVLPVLYAMFFRFGNKTGGAAKAVAAVLLLVGAPVLLPAQKTITETEALQIVREQHPAVQATNASIRSARALRDGAARTWEPAEIYHSIAADPDLGMFGTSTFGMSQAFPAARQTKASRSLFEHQAQVHEAERNLVRHQLTREVRDIFQHLSYLGEKSARLQALDSLYQITVSIAESRYKAGEVARDEWLNARDQAARIRLERETIGHETTFDQQVLGQLLGMNEQVAPFVTPFQRSSFSLADTSRIREGTFAQLDAGKTALSEAQVELERARRSPVFIAGLNAQFLGNGSIYPGYLVGLRLPLAQKSLRSRAEALVPSHPHPLSVSDSCRKYGCGEARSVRPAPAARGHPWQRPGRGVPPLDPECCGHARAGGDLPAAAGRHVRSHRAGRKEPAEAVRGRLQAGAIRGFRRARRGIDDASRSVP